MTTETIDYRDGETVLEATVAWPSGDGPAAAVLVTPAWAGGGPVEAEVATRLAADGHVGVVIDVYGKGVRGDPSGDNSHLIRPWLDDRAALLRRMMAAVDFVGCLPRVDAGRIAVTGYCFGGLCALDVARSGTDRVRGVVSLHGLLAGNGRAEDGPIAARILIEHGWRDPMADPAAFIAFGEEMTRRDADWQAHVHGRAMHAFTREGVADAGHGLQFDGDAARRSWASQKLFLAEVLAAA